MKKIITITLLLLSINLFAEESKTSFSITGGTDYLQDFYANFGFSVISPLQDNKELDLKVGLDITTKEEDSKTIPLVNIPLKLDINFLFQINETVTFLAGTGLSPTIKMTGDDTGFLIGPNIKLGLRFRVHPSMSIIFEGCQSLLIGPPDWMYSSTEVIVGINFFI